MGMALAPLLNLVHTKARFRRLSGEIFVIVVGGIKRFTAHENIISASPVFKAMCAGPFQESTTRTINLPDDDPLAFEILLEACYRKCTSAAILSQICVELIPADGDHPSELAKVYITADRYHLPRFQTVIVSLLRDLDLPDKKPLTFLNIAQTIYKNLSSPHGPFPDYFRAGSHIALRASREVVTDKIRDIVEDGGALAIDICDTLVLNYSWERERAESCTQQLQHEKQAATEEEDKLKKVVAEERSKAESTAAHDKLKLEKQWKEEKAEFVYLLSLGVTNRGEFLEALRKKGLASLSSQGVHKYFSS